MKKIHTLFIFLACIFYGSFSSAGPAIFERSVSVPSFALCDQIIDPVTDTTWSKITSNQSSEDVFCIKPGDHSGKGSLTLTSSGTSGSKKYLILHDITDGSTHPIDVVVSVRALLKGFKLIGADFWVVDRIQVGEVGNFTADLVDLSGGATNNILNRSIFENASINPTIRIDGEGDDDNTVQNSVVRFPTAPPPCSPSNRCVERGCIASHGGSDRTRIISNEIYNCYGDAHIIRNTGESVGSIVENNDMYANSDFYTDGSGNPDVNGDFSCMEGAIDIKQMGSSSGATVTRLIGNRIWGLKTADEFCVNGGFASADPIRTSVGDWPLQQLIIKDNVIFDNHIEGGAINLQSASDTFQPTNITIYRNYLVNNTGVGGKVGLETINAEIYKNTVIGASQYIRYETAETNSDIMCNLYINAGSTSGARDATTTMDYNAFFGTTQTTTGTNNINKTLNNRANSTSYANGDHITHTSQPDFIYAATSSGTSAASSPAMPATLGDSVTDGGVTWRAVMGPRCFQRKLLTGPEQVCLPFIRIHTSSILNGFCPGASDADTLGSRTGVGINNDAITDF